MMTRWKTVAGLREGLLLMGLLIATAGAIAFALAEPSTDPELMIAPAQAHASVRAGERLLVDIRTPSEWRETGIPEGAATADYNGLGRGDAFVAGIAALVEGERDAPIALICARGGRSARALDLLREAGFMDVRDVHEGMLGNRDGPGWLARGLPTEPVE